MEGVDGQEVGVVNDGDDGFSFGVIAAGFGDEAGFALGVAAVGGELEGLAEQSQEAGPGVEGAIDDGGDPLFGIVTDDGVFKNGFAGAWLAEDEAETALLAVDFEDVEVALLVFEQGGVVVDGEGVFAESEVGFNYGVMA